LHNEAKKYLDGKVKIKEIKGLSVIFKNEISKIARREIELLNE